MRGSRSEMLACLVHVWCSFVTSGVATMTGNEMTSTRMVIGSTLSWNGRAAETVAFALARRFSCHEAGYSIVHNHGAGWCSSIPAV
jgi:hypothetical protein